MTGYGRGHASVDGRELMIELKAVNHRFLDVSYRIPKALTFLEELLRARVNDGEMMRGHVDVSVSYQNHRADANTIVLDNQLVLNAHQATRTLAEELHKEQPDIAQLIQLSGAMIVTPAEEDTEAVTSLALRVYDVAYAQLHAMRVREGAALATDLATNLAIAKMLVKSIADRSPTVPLQYRERLNARLVEWNVQAADPQRLAQEVAMLADKCAIDEELTRLNSHFAQFAKCLDETGEVGRRMDFLLQEMNRETNTIGSKASDAQIAQYVVEMKCLLEKLREQVQNIV